MTRWFSPSASRTTQAALDKNIHHHLLETCCQVSQRKSFPFRTEVVQRRNIAVFRPLNEKSKGESHPLAAETRPFGRAKRLASPPSAAR